MQKQVLTTPDALDSYSQGTKVSAEHLVAAMVSRVRLQKKHGLVRRMPAYTEGGLQKASALAGTN